MQNREAAHILRRSLSIDLFGKLAKTNSSFETGKGSTLASLVNASSPYEPPTCFAMGEINAKVAKIKDCSSTVSAKTHDPLGQTLVGLLKSLASRQEKASKWRGNGARPGEHIRFWDSAQDGVIGFGAGNGEDDRRRIFISKERGSL